jgi:hypothetical protein
MTVGSWEPDSPKKEISMEAVIAAVDTISLEAFPKEPSDSILSLQSYSKSTKEDWSEFSEQLTSEQLKSLCRFFTLAESHWQDWEGGDKNPVIWIVKILKKRGDFPDKELTMWIKNNTDNRFLPYGNALG